MAKKTEKTEAPVLLTSADLAEVIADKHGISKKMAKEIIATVTSAAEETLKAGNIVRLTGIGTFRVVSIPKKKAHGICTKDIPAHKRVRFTASLPLKRAISKKKG